MRAFLRLGTVTLLGAALTIALGTGACDSDSEVPANPTTDAGEAGADVDASVTPEHFKATIRRTSMGVPHIQAADFGGAGYGAGYAFAEDNLCILAEELVTSRGQRAKYFGENPYDLGQTQREQQHRAATRSTRCSRTRTASPSTATRSPKR